MSVTLENFDFGTRWVDFRTDRYEGYLPNMSDYHMHEYYEISLILSGNVKLLLPETAHHGTESCLFLTGPLTPHMVTCEPDMLYCRINLLFSGQFIAEYVPEWKRLLDVFGKRGRIVPLSPADREEMQALAQTLQKEKDMFRKRLYLLLLLSKIEELEKQLPDRTESLPRYVTEALTYLQEHCAEPLVSADLAWHLGVGRTTMMTGFKHYTGTTVNEYLTRCRLKRAIALLKEGQPEQTVAEQCGLGSSYNMIRCFRRKFGKTPKQYLKDLK